MRVHFETMDEYIEAFLEKVRTILQEMRETIHEAAPAATEAISYQMPTFKLNGKNLVHFAAFEHHIGFYPTPSGIEAFRGELSSYDTAKGTVRFPLGEPTPCDLVRRITQFRAAEVSSKR